MVDTSRRQCSFAIVLSVAKSRGRKVGYTSLCPAARDVFMQDSGLAVLRPQVACKCGCRMLVKYRYIRGVESDAGQRSRHRSFVGCYGVSLKTTPQPGP